MKFYFEKCCNFCSSIYQKPRPVCSDFNNSKRLYLAQGYGVMCAETALLWTQLMLFVGNLDWDKPSRQVFLLL